mgnify:FL=1
MHEKIVFASFISFIAKKKSLSTLGIKNSWKYEKDLIHILKSKILVLLISHCDIISSLTGLFTFGLIFDMSNRISS